MSSIVTCTNCYYSSPRYNAKGEQIGIECSADNMRFLALDVARVTHCGRWAEPED